MAKRLTKKERNNKCPISNKKNVTLNRLFHVDFCCQGGIKKYTIGKAISFIRLASVFRHLLSYPESFLSRKKKMLIGVLGAEEGMRENNSTEDMTGEKNRPQLY